MSGIKAFGSTEELRPSEGSKPVMAAQPKPARFESEMRSLRSQLQALFEERKPTLLAIAPCGTGEGAGAIARELCRSLSMDGVKVLYCGRWDDELRSSLDILGAPPTGRTIVRSAIPTLCFVDITDLHASAGSVGAPIVFREWLEKVKGFFDVVITEAPPILNRPTFGALMSIQDGLLVVMEAEQTRSSVLKATLTALEVAGGHILGIIFDKRRKYIPEVFYKWI